MEVIKRIITQKNFGIYNIPKSFGKKAEIIILPYSDDENEVDNPISYDLMKAQEENGSANMLNEPEEDAWNEL